MGEWVMEADRSMSAAVRISVVIVSYNTREMTCACIRSVYEEARESDFEVIVIDNASNDGSADAIAAEFPQLHLIRSEKNLGFAGANNLAATYARGKYLLLLNPDTVVLDQAIDRLADFARAQPTARIWGGRTIFADGTLNPGSCWRFMSLWSLFAQAVGLTTVFPDTEFFNREGYGGWKRDRAREVDIVTGCFLLIELELWNHLGGFDASFFMYGEEADLCYRARLTGAHPTITPDATIIHYGGASENVLSGKVVRLFSGKIHFLRKHWSAPSRSVGIALFVLNVAIRAIAYKGINLLLRSKKYDGVAGEWRDVWSQRRAWTGGYSTNSEPAEVGPPT